MPTRYSEMNCETHFIVKPDEEYTRTQLPTFNVVAALALFHVALIACSIPYMICVPHGCHPFGYTNTISDGIRDNTVLASTLWGAGMTWVTASRYLGLASCSFWHKCIGHLCIIVSVYGSLVTTRYDALKSPHVAAAILWIVSSFLFHFCVTIPSSVKTSWIPCCVLIFGCCFGVVYVSMFSVVILHKSHYSNITLSTVSLFEIATVLCITLLDAVQCLQVLHI